MLHAFFEPGAWFAAKRYGYGSGRPIAWQGWVLLAVYVGAIVGAALLVDRHQPLVNNLAIGGGMAALTALFLLITARRTQGGWRWRWGK